MSAGDTAPRAEEQADIEDICQLTPLQSGMLFHSLKAERPGPYLEQFVFACAPAPAPADCSVPTAPDARALGAAWQAVLDRHPVLRTGFVWEEVDEPLQITLSRCHVPVDEADFTGTPPEQVTSRIENYLRADRARGLDLTRPPLMRIALLHTDEAAYLVWTVHHLVLDGWSMPRILDEVGRAYRGGPKALADLPPARPFHDYVTWLQRQDASAARRFWRGHLGPVEPPARLVLRPGRPAERRGRAAGGTALYDLPADLGAAARAAARSAQVSLSTWFQAAWAVTLSHTGPDPQLFGVTVAARPMDLPGVEEIVGPCVNTVPQRVDAIGPEPVRDWLADIQRRQNAALPHQHLGLADIQRLCGTGGAQPLFESIVAFENYPHQGTLLDLGPEVSVTLWKYVEDTTYPLTLVVLPGESTVQLQLFYDTERFEPAAVETVLGRLEAAVRAMADGLDRPVSAIRAAAAERSLSHGLHTDRTEPDGTAPARLPLHRIVERQAARTPRATAVDDHGTPCTYAELDERADRLAAALVAHGVGPDTVVALLLKRTTKALVSILAVLKAGGAYLALDPGHPDDRLRFLLTDSGAAVLLTEEATDGRVPGAEPPRLRVDRPFPAAEPPCPAVESGHLCYVTYTSGSTGRPKAVAMPHGPVANMLDWELAHGTVRRPARTFAQVSFTFDVSAQEIFTTWGSGGTLVLADEDDRIDFERLVELARDRGVERWYLSPTALGQVAEAAARLGVGLPALREVMVAGEPLEIGEPVRRLFATSQEGVRLENQYGSSEVQVVSSHRMSGDAADEGDFPRRPPVGAAIDDVSLYVLDADGEPVPYGVAGAVFVGGAAVPRGYVGHPRATAERLVPDPFSPVPGSRMYHTGDQGVLHPDGTLECLGRTDDQVKIRGYRIEPGEVRTALRAQPGVRDATVMVKEVDGDRRLLGYVVTDLPEGDRASHEQQLLTALRRVLPPAFVPWRIVDIDRVPLTLSGKVDRGALPDPEPIAPTAADRGTRPALALMTRLWQTVLATGPVAPDADFLALGGDSLLAIRLTSQVRSAFGVRLGVGRLFEAPTPRQLLATVDAQLGGDEAADRIAGPLL